MSTSNRGSYLATYLNKLFGANFKKRLIVKLVGILYVASIGISIATLVLEN